MREPQRVYLPGKRKIEVAGGAAGASDIPGLNHVPARVQGVDGGSAEIARMSRRCAQPHHSNRDTAGIGCKVGIGRIYEGNRSWIRRRPEGTRVVGCRRGNEVESKILIGRYLVEYNAARGILIHPLHRRR